MTSCLLSLKHYISHFLPLLFGSTVSVDEHLLYTSPVCWNGLNIKNPVKISSTSFETSSSATQYLVNCIKGLDSFESETHNDIDIMLKNFINWLFKNQMITYLQMCLLALANHANVRFVVPVDCVSPWLTVLSLSKEHFNLSTFEFCDIPALQWDLWHSFDLSMLAWKQVIKEPIIRDTTDTLSGEILKADIAIRGVWQPQATTSFDVYIIGTDAPSYAALSQYWLWLREGKRTNICLLVRRSTCHLYRFVYQLMVCLGPKQHPL